MTRVHPQRILLRILSSLIAWAASGMPPCSFAAQALVPVSFEPLDLQCVGTGGIWQMVIDSQEAYQRLIDTSPDLHPHPFLPCEDYTFPQIDFSAQTLLGSAVSGACRMSTEPRIVRDETTKQYVYRITVPEFGTCESAVWKGNWVLMPKLPPGYAVKFEIERSRSPEDRAPGIR